jgi:hypothetical protein
MALEILFESKQSRSILTLCDKHGPWLLKVYKKSDVIMAALTGSLIYTHFSDRGKIGLSPGFLNIMIQNSPETQAFP